MHGKDASISQFIPVICDIIIYICAFVRGKRELGYYDLFNMHAMFCDCGLFSDALLQYLKPHHFTIMSKVESHLTFMYSRLQ